MSLLFAIAHACPERRLTLKKCHRTNKGIPIFAKAAQPRKVIPNFFHRALFEKNIVLVQGPRNAWKLGWGVENSVSKCAVIVENPGLKLAYNVENSI